MCGSITSSRRSGESNCSVYARATRASHSPAKGSTTFCDRIDNNTYEEQRQQIDKELLKLLDTIADLPPAKKFEALKTAIIFLFIKNFFF